MATVLARGLSGLAALLAPLAAACSPAPNGGAARVEAAVAPTDGGASAAAAHVATGVVAIDVQRSFVDTATRRNPARDVPSVLARTRQVFEQAGALRTPFFITYEAATTGDHALAPGLAPAVPSDAQSFVKTTFAATGQPQFAAAVRASGVRRVLVLGAETDVCVLQTMLGLRRAGLEVVAAVDTLFTEEANVAPALRRMQQAGVELVGMDRVDAVIAGEPLAGATPPEASPPVIVRSLEMGIVLHDLEHMSADTNAAAKRARLRELLMVSEWFQLPVFAVDPARASAALSSDLKAILSRPIQPLAGRSSKITQLAVAGAHAGATQAAASLRTSGVDVFVITDALIGGAFAELEPAWQAGAIPTTYKALYYELVKSVSDDEWPSPAWVAAGDRWYDLTSAPEDLPPVIEAN